MSLTRSSNGAAPAATYRQPSRKIDTLRRGGRLTDDRRAEIERKAAALFIEKGYENVTINDIIALVGGSKTTIYAQFGGKEGLFETVIRKPCVEVTMALTIDPKAGIDRQLTQIARNFLKAVLDPRIIELHRLMVSIGKTFPTTGRLFYECGPQTAYTIVAEWVRTQQRAGVLRKSGDAQQLAALFLDMLLGEHQLALLISMPKAAQPKAVERTIKAAVSLFLNGAATAPKRLR